MRDLVKSERFYSGVMRFKLQSKSSKLLVYKTGYFELYIVKDMTKAKNYLLENSCKIISKGKNWLYLQDPNGFVFDIIEK